MFNKSEQHLGRTGQSKFSKSEQDMREIEEVLNQMAEEREEELNNPSRKIPHRTKSFPASKKKFPRFYKNKEQNSAKFTKEKNPSSKESTSKKSPKNGSKKLNKTFVPAKALVDTSQRKTNNHNPENKNIFLIMIGPSGSGKSTMVKKIKDELEIRDKSLGLTRQTLVMSSDLIKDELYGVDRIYDKSKNQEVFALLHRRIKELCDSCNIIIDATNLTLKTRQSLINCTKKSKNNIFYVAYIMTTPIEVCQEQNKMREGVARVPEDVIEKHVKSFEIPIFEEGFDYIAFQNWSEEQIHNFKLGWNLKTDPIFNRTIGFDQKNPHHLYYLDQHILKAMYGICNYFGEYTVPPKTMIRAAMIHDVGKLFTGAQKVDEEGNPIPNHFTYKGHANYGAYLLLQNLDILGFNTTEDLVECIAIVNYHMEPFKWRVEQKDGQKIVLPKTTEKMKQRYGRLYDFITLFNIFDKKASGTEDADVEEYMKPKKKKKEKVKPQGLTKKQKRQLKKQAKKERKRLKREKEKQKELSRKEYQEKRKQKELEQKELEQKELEQKEPIQEESEAEKDYKLQKEYEAKIEKGEST